MVQKNLGALGALVVLNQNDSTNQNQSNGILSLPMLDYSFPRFHFFSYLWANYLPYATLAGVNPFHCQSLRI